MCSSMRFALSMSVLVTLLVGGEGIIRRKAGPCGFLTNVKPTGYSGYLAPFKLYTRSRSPVITSGKPLEVTIGPFSRALSMFNFTSFILYAQPVVPRASGMEFEFMPSISAQAPQHIGVFQIFRRWAAGAGAMNCNPRSRSEDTVGAYEDLILPPHYAAPARNQVSVLWWPTREALAFPEIKFTANIKSGGKWYKIDSTPWKVNRPVDQWAMTERMLNQYQMMQQNLNAMERRLDQPV